MSTSEERFQHSVLGTGQVVGARRQGRELRFHGLHHRTLIQEAIEARIRRVRELAAVQRPTG